jgi:hypothetical protein
MKAKAAAVLEEKALPLADLSMHGSENRSQNQHTPHKVAFDISSLC